MMNSGFYREKETLADAERAKSKKIRTDDASAEPQ